MISSLSEHIHAIPFYLFLQQLIHIVVSPDNIHRTPEQVFQKLLQCYQHIDIRFHIHTDIHVAFCVMLVSGYGPKDARERIPNCCFRTVMCFFANSMYSFLVFIMCKDTIKRAKKQIIFDFSEREYLRLATKVAI